MPCIFSIVEHQLELFYMTQPTWNMELWCIVLDSKVFVLCKNLHLTNHIKFFFLSYLTRHIIKLVPSQQPVASNSFSPGAHTPISSSPLARSNSPPHPPLPNSLSPPPPVTSTYFSPSCHIKLVPHN